MFSSCIAFFVGFVIAVVPRRLKRQRPWSLYATAAPHVFSGIAELGIAVGLYALSLTAYARDFHATTQGALAAGPGMPNPVAVGTSVVVLLGHAIHPASILLAIFVVDGLVRALDAGVTGGRRGVWIVELADTLLRLAGRKLAGRALSKKLGPPRPDEVVRPGASASGLLELYSVEDKPFFEQQVVRVDGCLYIIQEWELRRRGPHHAYYYGFRPLRPGEVIRGNVLELDEPG